MSKTSDEGNERTRLIDLWKKTKNAAFLRAAAQLKRDSDEPDEADSGGANESPVSGLLALEPRRGRREEQDLIPLIAMGLMIKKDPSLSVLGAAKKVAEMMPENKHVELSSVHDRLRRRYKKFEDNESFEQLVEHASEIRDALPEIRAIIEKLPQAIETMFDAVAKFSSAVGFNSKAN
jgi:hypothetical protein